MVVTSPPSPGPDELRRVAPGLYFQSAQALPRGRHQLAADAVLSAQRERILVAFTELLAAVGYGSLTVAPIVRRAGVSRAAFYSCFSGLADCATAGYDRFIAVLLEHVAAGLRRTDDFAEFAISALEGYLGTLQQDLVVARAYQVEMDAAGAEARRRRREALGVFADVLQARFDELRSSDARLRELPHAAHLGLVYAVRQLACDALEQQAEPDLRSLVPDAAAWIGATYLGDPRAIVADA